jgi:selenium metabolism protein YedF
MKEIDARGLACPEPVLQTKAALQENDVQNIQVVVDNGASQQNVQRFLESRGFQTQLKQKDADFVIIGTSSGTFVEPVPVKTRSEQECSKIMVMCAADTMGSGDDELGRKLMVNCIRTLKEMGVDLWQLVFVNGGVKLTIDESDVLDDLQQLEQVGLTILVCGTCLDHFKLLEQKRVGVTTNMLDIVTAMQLSDKVINL